MINLFWDETKSLALPSTSSTRTVAVAFDVWPVIVSPTVNLTLESSRTTLSLFSSTIKLTDVVSWRKKLLTSLKVISALSRNW